MAYTYQQLKDILAPLDRPLPAMLVDLDVLDANTRRISEIAAASGKRLRIASKSLRVPALLKRVMDEGGAHFKGLMCYSASEANYLSEQGFSDLLLAYPTVQPPDLQLLWKHAQANTPITLMLDCVAHVELVSQWWANNAAETSHSSPKPLPVCIDADMSYRPANTHLGVQRSSIRDIKAFATVCRAVIDNPMLALDGVMGYEAQIAGMGAANPFSAWLNPAKKLIKHFSKKDVMEKRKTLATWLAQEGIQLRFFNGGGTGSLRSTCQEAWLTEVTAGSGFLQSHLFDYYVDNRNEPALYFALQITRTPQDGIATCHGGGFIASGEIGADKAPRPYLPEGLETIPQEGFGEVQTPLILPAGHKCNIGDPIFFRPAKAGEIAEHFSEYILIRSGQIEDIVPTYRGLGHRFH